MSEPPTPTPTEAASRRAEDRPRPPAAASGPIDTDVHFYLREGTSSVLPYLSNRWRRDFERRGAYLGEAPGPSKFDFPYGSRRRRDARPPDGGLPGSDAEFARTDLLDRYNLSGAVMSSLEAGQQGQGLSGTDASPALCAAFNDLAIEQWLSTDRRFRLAMCVPSIDPDAAAAEVRRIGAHPGISAVYLPLLHIPIGNRYFYPIYAAAQGLSLPIFLHITAAEYTYPGLPAFPTSLDSFAERRVAYALMGPSTLISLVFSRVFHEFPELNFVFAEFGFAWVAPLMWRMDAVWRQARSETPWLRKPPSEYVRERVRFGTQPVEDPENATDMGDLIAMMGSECLMFSTDYPHWDTDSPSSVFQFLAPGTKHQVFNTNAEQTFRWS
jgi:uncharacterized protein